jgi:purine-binding chemotaxis protein CheW
MQFLLFKAGKDNFALDAFAVQQIHLPVPVTRLPYVADYVSGLVNIEGEVMPQIDLRKLLRLSSSVAGELLVINTHNYKIALLVDSALEKVVVDASQINDFRQTATEANTEKTVDVDSNNATSENDGVADYIQSELMLNGKTCLILNIDHLLRIIKPEKVEEGEQGITARKQLQAAQKTGEEAKTGYLTFRLGKETLALPLLQIMEVIEIDHFTHIPGAPSYITGLAVLRSHPLLVITSSALLDLSAEKSGITNQVLIVQYQNTWLGLLVDEVFGIQYFAQSQVIKETSAVSFIDAYVIDHRQQIILLLNLQSLFQSRYTRTIEQYLPRVELNVNTRKIETIKLLKILLGKEVFAIPVQFVQRIANFKQYAHIEETEKGIIGTVDLDGNIIPVVNMNKKLNAGKIDDLEQWVVITYQSEQWALCVSKATALFDLDVEVIDYSASGRESVKGIANYKGELISILDFAWLKDTSGNTSASTSRNKLS